MSWLWHGIWIDGDNGLFYYYKEIIIIYKEKLARWYYISRITYVACWDFPPFLFVTYFPHVAVEPSITFRTAEVKVIMGCLYKKRTIDWSVITLISEFIPCFDWFLQLRVAPSYGYLLTIICTIMSSRFRYTWYLTFHSTHIFLDHDGIPYLLLVYGD